MEWDSKTTDEDVFLFLMQQTADNITFAGFSFRISDRQEKKRELIALHLHSATQIQVPVTPTTLREKRLMGHICTPPGSRMSVPFPRKPGGGGKGCAGIAPAQPSSIAEASP